MSLQSHKVPVEGAYIASDAALVLAAEHWLTVPALGIDTEFIRADTFHPIPALIQVSDGQHCWLIDVLRVKDFSPFARVLTDPSVIKVVHAASEDLEVFDRLLHVLPEPLFDTQIAAAFCCHGASIGYSRLVQAVLSIEISKDQCRSDWLARPLTVEQKHYACLDVLYLPTLYGHLHLELTRQQRLHWAMEDNSRQLARYCEQRDAVYSIERISSINKLNTQERRCLWHLLLGRDALARSCNKPRNHIARDHVLVDIARKPPRHLGDLSAIDGFTPSSIRRFGEQFLQLARTVPPDLLCPFIAEPLSRAEAARAKAARALADSIARRLDLPPDLLLRRQELEQLIRSHSAANAQLMPARFSGWRGDVLRDALLVEIENWR